MLLQQQQIIQKKKKRKPGNLKMKLEKISRRIDQREDLNEFHLQLSDDKKDSPLILIELSKAEWQRLKKIQLTSHVVTSKS